ncbi:MAG: hypothetical protein ACLPGW_20565 [Roseiarcus sp.]
MPRYLALAAEWRANPPAHWLLAAALKYRPADRGAETPARPPTAAELKAAFPEGRL